MWVRAVMQDTPICIVDEIQFVLKGKKGKEKKERIHNIKQ